MTTDHERAERAAYERGVADTVAAVVAIVRAQSYAADTNVGKRQQWVKDEIERRVLALVKPPEAEATATRHRAIMCPYPEIGQVGCTTGDESDIDKGHTLVDMPQSECPVCNEGEAAPPSASRATAPPSPKAAKIAVAVVTVAARATAERAAHLTGGVKADSLDAGVREVGRAAEACAFCGAPRALCSCGGVAP